MASCLYRHVIREADIWAEELKIGACLIDGGYDPQELPLTPVAVHAKLRDLHDDARNLGIHVHERHYCLTVDGDVEVIFRVDENDAVALKLKFG
jgi:hypothetical protein